MQDRFDMRDRLATASTLLQRANLNMEKLKSSASPALTRSFNKVSDAVLSSSIRDSPDEMLKKIDEMNIIGNKMHQFQINTIKQHHTTAKLMQKSIQQLMEKQFQSLREINSIEMNNLEESIKLKANLEKKAEKLQDTHDNQNLSDYLIDINSQPSSKMLAQIPRKLEQVEKFVTNIDERVNSLSNELKSTMKVNAKHQISLHRNNLRRQKPIEWTPIEFKCLLDTSTSFKSTDYESDVRIIKEPQFVVLKKTSQIIRAKPVSLTPQRDKSYYISSDSQHGSPIDEKSAHLGELSPVSVCVNQKKSQLSSDKRKPSASSLSIHREGSDGSKMFGSQNNIDSKSLPTATESKGFKIYTNSEISAAYHELLEENIEPAPSSDSKLSEQQRLNLEVTRRLANLDNASEQVCDSIVGEVVADLTYAYAIEKSNQLKLEMFKRNTNRIATPSQNPRSEASTLPKFQKFDTSISEEKQKQLIMGLLGSDTSVSFNNSKSDNESSKKELQPNEIGKDAIATEKSQSSGQKMSSDSTMSLTMTTIPSISEGEILGPILSEGEVVSHFATRGRDQGSQATSSGNTESSGSKK